MPRLFLPLPFGSFLLGIPKALSTPSRVQWLETYRPLPNVPEDYVHRIGRTGRAGEGGAAVSLVSADEHGLLRDIERLLKRSIPVKDIEGFQINKADANEPIKTGRGGGRGGNRGGGRGEVEPAQTHGSAGADDGGLQAQMVNCASTYQYVSALEVSSIENT